MGPFFYSKKDMPANSGLFKSIRLLRFFLEIPPKATIFFFVNLDRSLNLFNPK